MVARGRHSLIILECQFFAFLAFEIVVHIGDCRRHFENNEDIRAQVKHLLRHIIVDTGDERDHGDYGSYANDHAQQSQHRAEFIRPQRLQRDFYSFG